MLEFLTAILQALVGWFKSKTENQLIELGEKRNQENVLEAEHKAAEQVDKIIKDIDSLPVNTVNERLSKWERD